MLFAQMLEIITAQSDITYNLTIIIFKQTYLVIRDFGPKVCISHPPFSNHLFETYVLIITKKGKAVK